MGIIISKGKIFLVNVISDTHGVFSLEYHSHSFEAH